MKRLIMQPTVVSVFIPTPWSQTKGGHNSHIEPTESTGTLLKATSAHNAWLILFALSHSLPALVQDWGSLLELA